MKKARLMIKIIVFFILLFIGIDTLTGILRDKTEAEYLYPFYHEDEREYEVLLLGSSVVKDGFYPLELWGKYGILSYNIASAGQQFAPNYFLLKDIIKRYVPEIVVLDVFSITRGDALYESKERVHQLADNMPFLSLSKYEMAEEFFGIQGVAEFLFPISLYHTRWKEIGAEDSISVENAFLGASFVTKITPFAEPAIVDKSTKTESESKNKEYLLKIIELCKENNIELVLTALPFNSIAEERQKMENYIYDIAEEYAVPYLNYWHLIEETGLDFSTDFYNNNHLNYCGAIKVTRYLGAYLKENYDLGNYRGKEGYEAIDTMYEAYAERLKRMEVAKLTSTEDVVGYLDEYVQGGYIVMMSMKDQFNKNLPNELVEKLRSYGMEFPLTELETKYYSYLAVIEDGELKYEKIGDEELKYSFSYDNYTFELISCGFYAGNASSIKLNDIEYAVNGRGINICIFDKREGKMISSFSIDYFTGEYSIRINVQ